MRPWPLGIAACALALASCGTEPPTDIAPMTGEQIFLAKCAACHQADGSGIPAICPPLSTSPRLGGPPEEIVRILLLGMKGRIVRDGRTYNGIMPAWRFDLNDAQVASVIATLHLRWKPESPKPTPDLVRRIREETTASKLFPSAKDLGLAD